jgi:hypothetical protein
MLRLLPLALLPLLTLIDVQPAAAATCGVPAARAVYDTAAVQVFRKQARLYACYRPTGRQRLIGAFVDDGMGTNEGTSVNGLLAGRWLHTNDYGTYAESADYSMDELIDLRTGRTVKAMISGDYQLREVVALPGALVQAGSDGVLVRFTDGTRRRLDTAPAEALAVTGARVYWRTASGPQSAVLPLPAAEPERALPRAHRTSGCTPRAGARLVVNDYGVIVTRVGDVTYACRKGRTREVGIVTGARVVSTSEVSYTRAGATGVLDVAGGKRRELDGPGVSTGSMLLAGGPAGLRAWPDDQPAPAQLAAGPVSDVAFSDAFSGRVAYWLDASGIAQSAAI